MPDKKSMPATDSERDLVNLVGDDVTADFETDPKFVDSNPTADASNENLAMRDTDDEEDSDDELEDEDDDDFDDDEVDEDDEDLDDDEVADDIEEEDEEQEEEEDEPDEELAARHPFKLILKHAA